MATTSIPYVAPEATDGVKTNVNVIRETPPNLEPRIFDEVAVMLREQVAPGAIAGTPSKIHKLKLAGTPARAWGYESKRNGTRLKQGQVVALKGDALYTVTFSVHADESERSEKQFKQILRTWRWSG